LIDSDCVYYFGERTLLPIDSDDAVICDTEFSKIVPLESGEIVVELLKDRPSKNQFFNSTVLQEWTRATTVRFRFLRAQTLSGHLMSVRRHDPTVTRRVSAFTSVRGCLLTKSSNRVSTDTPRSPLIGQCP
jgi:laminin alpha 3/5